MAATESTQFSNTGDWRLTSPDPAYFGEHRTLRTENLVFDYFERDARWFEGRLPAELQAIISQVTTDLGIEIDGQIFTVTSELQPGIDGWLSEDGALLRYTSPSVTGWPIHHPDDQMFQMSLTLTGALFQDILSSSIEDNFNHYLILISAFVWEFERLFPEQFALEIWFEVDTTWLATLTLTDLWTEPTPEQSDYDFEREWIGYYTLLQYLSETYGAEIIAVLLDSSLRTDDLDEWLRLSTGDGVAEIEPAWQAWVSATYKGQ